MIRKIRLAKANTTRTLVMSVLLVLVLLLGTMVMSTSPAQAAGPTLYEFYNIGADASDFTAGTSWDAQTFTAQSDHLVTSVKLSLCRSGSPGTLTVSIRTTNASGHPTVTNLASGTTDGNTLPLDCGNPEWREIALGGCSLKAGTKYAIVVRALSGSHQAGNRVCWSVKLIGTYAGGNAEASSNSGGAWVSNPLNDYMFEVWGPATNATSHGQVRVVSADSFTSTGCLMSGWWWFCDDINFTDYATWEFSGIQYNPAAVGPYIYIRFDPCLVTNKGDGGSGYSTSVRVTYSKRGTPNTATATVQLKNLHSEVMDPIGNSGGWGWNAYGVLRLAVGQLPLDGHIVVTMKRTSTYPKPVAVKADSCTIEYKVP